ncbi:Gamma-glutamylcyclotransferase [Pleurostoma richardsiae]|uniref:glutathione-specific gamma-glutamylcyclotransferase n=1 Tax=Pleurostoma richardsiae TaxID=41990 RepID=A0AA38RFG3_9PEZI|nr:Gamma-glutamylcyclotransferase [Pleurostoma richardsiae]
MPVVDLQTPADQEEFWLFGYGSLIWKPPPHFDRRVPGWVTGYVRRFWQDHRGTPEAPGRVVTLIERPHWEKLADHHATAPEKVWGTAYRILAEKVVEVKEYLDIREINGYTIHYTPFYPADGSPPLRALVYIGTPQNDQFTGPQPVQTLAEHIYRSQGPSGLNQEYLLSLEHSLDELGPESGDGHVTDLANRVRVLIQHGRKKRVADSDADLQSLPTAETAVAHHEFKEANSISEQEETEKAH